MSKLLQLALVAVSLVGLVFVWQTGQQRQASRLEYERLIRLVGDLPLTDPGKIHVLALDTGEPLHFAWRIYLPPKCSFHARYQSGSSSSYYSDPQEFIARVRFREQPDGRMQIYTKFAGGSGQSGFGDDSLANFLRGRWDQIGVEQLGTGKPAILDLDKEARLLRLTLPDDLHAQATEKVDARSLQEKLPLLFEVHITGKPQP